MIYIPPNLLANENLEIINFLIKTYDEHLIKYPDKNIIICGDFNKIDLKYLEIHHNLLNIINIPTRKDSILDICLVKNKLQDQFDISVREPLSSSDHNVIIIYKSSPQHSKCTGKRTIFDLRKSQISKVLSEINIIDWSSLYMLDTVELKSQFFYTKLKSITNKIPKKCIKLKSTDKPWITPIIKNLINNRWHAFKNRDFARYNHFKQKIKLEIEKSKKIWVQKEIRNNKNIWKILKDNVDIKKKEDISTFLSNFESPENYLNQKIG